MGGWFYNEGNGKFLKHLHIVGKGVLTPLFYEDPPILPTPLLFFKCCIPPSLQLHFPVTSNPHPHCSFCLLVSFAEWVITTHLMCHFNDNMDLHMSSLGTLVTEGPWCVFYATDIKFVEFWHIMWFFTSTQSDFHTQTHIAHSRASRVTHPFKNIYQLLCSHGSYLYHIKLLD